MKKIFLSCFFLIVILTVRATELNVGNVIINFPCLVKGSVKSGDTETFSGNTAQIAFQFQIIREQKDNTASVKTYDDFIKTFLLQKNGTLLHKEDRTVNGKKVKYFSSTFTKDGTEYLSESIVYRYEKTVYHLHSVKKNDQVKLADVEIFFNSLILLK